MGQASYTVDVRPILEDLGGNIPLEADVAIQDIELGTELFSPTRPVRVIADITNTGAGIVVLGTLDAEFRATCSRCLREFALPITAPLEGFYVSPGHDREIPEEQEFGYITDSAIDLMDQIIAALVLELPFAPLHAADCPGICPACGQDLAEGACGCAPDRPTSPFAALKDLLGDDEEV